MKKYIHQNIFIAILFFKEFSFQACDDVLNTKNYLAFRALTTMNKNQMSLGQAKKLFGLWDNAYHANGLKNLDPARRWDPTKMSKLIMKKGGESSSDEETDGELLCLYQISLDGVDVSSHLFGKKLRLEVEAGLISIG